MPVLIWTLQGDLSGWTLRNGRTDGSVNYSFIDNGPGTPGANFLIVNGGNDPIGGFPRVNPNGGSYSCRLGDGTATGGNAARMYKSFLVNNTNTIFKFSYAVVFQDPNHTSNQQPYFTFRVFDENGDGVECAEYAVIAGGGIDGFQAAGNVLYKDWATVLVDLTAYIGQNMTVEFTSGDCSPRGHYGYAYIDAGCTSPEIVASDDNALICPGETITLSALGGENTDMDFLWNTGETTESISVSQPGTYTVTLIPPIGDPVNCAITLSKDIHIQTIKTTALFEADTVCIGDITNFIDHSSLSPTGQDNIQAWAWDFGDGNSSTQQNPAHTYMNDGIYNVTLTVTSPRGCSNDTTLQIVVNPLPIADFNFSNVCLNEEMILTDNSNSTTEIIRYNWDVDGNGTTDYYGDTIHHTYSHANTYNVNLTIEDKNGCINSRSQQVIVYHLPVADFSASFVCEDTTTVFFNNSNVNPANGSMVNNYNWSFGNGSSSTLENPAEFYGSEGVYNVELVVTTNYGCQDSISRAIEVYPLPVANFFATDVCLDFPTTFQDQSSISNAHTTNAVVQWSWDFSDGASSSVKNPYHNYTSDGTYNVELTVVSNNGCTDNIVLPVIVHALPAVSFLGDNLEGCAPICPKVTSTSTINSTSSIAHLEWILSDGSSYNGDSFTDCYDNLTGNNIYYGLTLRATSDKGCIDEYTANNFISIYHNPIASFDYSPTRASIVNPEISFHNTSQYADHYNWNTGYQTGITEINPVIEYPYTAKEYAVTLTAYTNEGCIDTATAIIKINDEVIFYVPNTFTPDNDDHNEMFTPIFAGGINTDTYTLSIYNRWGEVLFQSHDVETGWKGTYMMNPNETVRDGTYIWKIEFKETMSDRRHSYLGHVNVLR